MGLTKTPYEKGAEYLDALDEKKPEIVSSQELIHQGLEVWKSGGLKPGDDTGWMTLDSFYSVEPGQLSVVTGWPGSGKSTWVSALAVNLAMRHGWKFVVYSPESWPSVTQSIMLAQQMSGKPFQNHPDKMNIQEAEAALENVAESFCILHGSSGSLNIADILEVSAPALADFKGHRQGLIIDPWNELDHSMPYGEQETLYVSKQLSIIRNWARRHNIHVWIVAHPSKIKVEGGKVPVARPMDIAGSQNWWNKPDICLSVFRDFESPDKTDIEIYVQKCRFSHIGRIGCARLWFNPLTGTYRIPPPKAVGSVSSVTW